MRGYTYLLKSKKANWHYIGSTKDLRNRFKEHNQGKVKSTKFYKPFILIYYEAYGSCALAKKKRDGVKEKGPAKRIIIQETGYKIKLVGSHSGRLRLLGVQVCLYGHHEFESHTHR